VAATGLSFLSFVACGCCVAHADYGEAVASVAGVFSATATLCYGCHHCGVAQCGRKPNNPYMGVWLLNVLSPLYN